MVKVEPNLLITKLRLFSLKNRKTSSWRISYFELCAILNQQILVFKDFCESTATNSGSHSLQAGAS